LTFFLSVASIFLFVLLCASLYFNYKFGKTIVEVQSSLEESLDVLDQNYVSISQVLEKPVFFDSLEVRQVIEDIKKSRDAVLYVANTLVGPFDKAGEQENKEDPS
tara:strand:+ start:1726 stop:2040 length:315 start_codon:yes stop_codon:yes gene_type:complete